MLDKWSPSDIQTDKVFREMANHQLGPFLQVGVLAVAVTGGDSACVTCRAGLWACMTLPVTRVVKWTKGWCCCIMLL